ASVRPGCDAKRKKCRLTLRLRLAARTSKAARPAVLPAFSQGRQDGAWRLLPVGFGSDQLGRCAFGGPDHFELAALPLADGSGHAGVLAILEGDLAQNGVELGRGDVVAQRLAVEAHLLDGLLQDLEAGPGVAACPAIRLFAGVLDVRVKIEIGRASCR